MADNKIPEDISTMMTALVEFFEKQCEGGEYSEKLSRDLIRLELPKELRDRVMIAIDNCVMRRSLSEMVKKMYAGEYQPDSGEEKLVAQTTLRNAYLHPVHGAPYSGGNPLRDAYEKYLNRATSDEIVRKCSV